MIAPAGINLEINGRGGDDSLDIGSNSLVTIVNNVGSDGTVLSTVVGPDATLAIPNDEVMPPPVLDVRIGKVTPAKGLILLCWESE